MYGQTWAVNGKIGKIGLRAKRAIYCKFVFVRHWRSRNANPYRAVSFGWSAVMASASSTGHRDTARVVGIWRTRGVRSSVESHRVDDQVHPGVLRWLEPLVRVRQKTVASHWEWHQEVGKASPVGWSTAGVCCEVSGEAPREEAGHKFCLEEDFVMSLMRGHDHFPFGWSTMSRARLREKHRGRREASSLPDLVSGGDIPRLDARPARDGCAAVRSCSGPMFLTSGFVHCLD